MKVTTDTPDLLIVDDRPVFIAVMLILFILAFVGAGLLIVSSGEWTGLLFGAMGGGLGLTGYALFVRRTQLVLHRPESWAELRRKSLFSRSTDRYDLQRFERAEVEESRSSEGSITRRIAIVIEAEDGARKVPLTEAYISGASQGRIAETINKWLGVAP